MAQVTIVQLIDDIDGGEATQTLTFALDGTNYEIDLNDKNADSLRDALAPFVEKGRKLARGTKASGGRRAPGATSLSSSPERRAEHLSEVRAWAVANGHQVSERGRIPRSVMEAFKAAS